MYLLLYLLENVERIKYLLILLSIGSTIGLFIVKLSEGKYLKYWFTLLLVTVSMPSEKIIATMTIYHLSKQEKSVIKNDELYNTLYSIVMYKVINQPQEKEEEQCQ